MTKKEKEFCITVLWICLWLFTVGLCDLAWHKMPTAIIIWPYFLGDFARTLWIK